MEHNTRTTIRFAAPKGRMYSGVAKLMEDAGVGLQVTSRDYRPASPIEDFEVKILKPRAIIEMLDLGARDLGFAGADWVADSGASPVELLDTESDPVRLVAAAPATILEHGALPNRPIIVASEYSNLTLEWIKRKGLDATLLHSYGATEVLPPEDADCIIDNTATGSTLTANNLIIIDEVMRSSTRLYASRHAMDDPARRDRIEHFVMLMRSVLEARRRALIEMNVSKEALDAVIAILPCMREPTVAPTHGSMGFAVKAAVPRSALPKLIPQIKARGGTDIIVVTPEQIVP